MKRPTMLLIMDGFGLAPAGPGNAVAAANTPNIDQLWNNNPHTMLNASGRAVGLPDGQMGNSEVGHTNMGAGRVVWQELSKITNAVEDGSFFENEELKAAMLQAKETGRSLHLMGLLSDGGVHSHLTHILALLDMAKRLGLTNVYLHGILDGRDVPPRCAEKYIKAVEDHMAAIGCGRLASISGRYYAMDRDSRWERLVLAYDNYTLGEGRHADSALGLLEQARENDENDEFVLPGCVCENGEPIGLIEDGDSMIFFNFRPDRAREITRTLVDPDFAGFERKKLPKGLKYVCFTTYDATIPNVSIAFKPQSLDNILGAYVSAAGKTQLRIAETEKYAHVTFFFNAGREEPYAAEERILIPSPKVATYDLQPEMSAYLVTEKVLEKIEEGNTDLIIMNLANCDMVGHTGVFEAAVKACEAVDTCVGKIAEAMAKVGGQMLITADHGNADQMLAEDGSVMTAHSSNPVPLIMTGTQGWTLKSEGALCDLAPTLLQMMGMEQPCEMTGCSLLVGENEKNPR
ncbi:MAG: 2,3-bisphosphoglycerate-independent phosphoglycerate mutase [Firmicutes bacterium]|nr:2,3-bisphosphoglycerate-independent phosphoglycerate mutase [Bacillota bacterium]